MPWAGVTRLSCTVHDDRHVIESGNAKLFIEEPQTTPTGEQISLLTSKVPLRDEAGNIIGVLGTYLDVTERKRAAEELKESEISYRGLFNTIQQALYLLDREGKFVDVNCGAEQMYGYAREEFVGRTPEFLSAPGKNDLPAVAEKIQKAFAGEPQEFEFWGLRKNGEEFPKDVHLYKGTYFGEDVVLAIGADITERRLAENALRESENKFATMFRSNPVSMTLVSALDGTFVDVNDAFVACTGYTREEVIGRTSGELGIFTDPQEYEQLVSRLQSTRHVDGMEMQIREKTGRVRDLPVFFRHHPDGGKTVHSFDRRRYHGPQKCRIGIPDHDREHGGDHRDRIAGPDNGKHLVLAWCGLHYDR